MNSNVSITGNEAVGELSPLHSVKYVRACKVIEASVSSCAVVFPLRVLSLSSSSIPNLGDLRLLLGGRNESSHGGTTSMRPSLSEPSFILIRKLTLHHAQRPKIRWSRLACLYLIPCPANFASCWKHGLKVQSRLDLISGVGQVLRPGNVHQGQVGIVTWYRSPVRYTGD